MYVHASNKSCISFLKISFLQNTIKAFIPIVITLSNVKKRISFVLSTLALSNAIIAILVVITIDVKAPSRHYCVFVWKRLFMRFRLSSTLQRSKTLTKTFCNVETSENASFWKRSGCSVDRWKRRFSKTMTSGRRKQLKTHECGSMKRKSFGNDDLESVGKFWHTLVTSLSRVSSVDRWKRYENNKADENILLRFRPDEKTTFENTIVWMGPKLYHISGQKNGNVQEASVNVEKSTKVLKSRTDVLPTRNIWGWEEINTIPCKRQNKVT